MKYFSVVLFFLSFIVSVYAAEPNSVVLKKVSLDDASSIGMKIEADTKIKVEGKASIKITTKWPTSICLGEVNDVNVENERLIYQAQVKSNLNDAGNAYLELWAYVKGGKYFSRGLDSTVVGQTDWKTLNTPFIFLTGQKPDRIVLNVIINGYGTLWIDDIVLSKQPLESKTEK
jgi:hypothetical protein